MSGYSANKVGLRLSILTGLHILVSFGLQMFVVMHFGAGAVADAFYAGGTVPTIVTGMLIETLAIALIPILSPLDEQRIREHGWILLAAAVGVLVPLTALLFLAAPVLIPLFVAGFSEEAKALTIDLTRIQICGLVGSAVAGIITVTCQVRGRFLAPAIVSLISLFISFGAIVWKLPEYGIALVAWMQVFAATLSAVCLLPWLGQPRFVGSPGLFRRVATLMRPLTISKIFYLTSLPIDHTIASFLGPGSLVTFSLVARFYLGIARILAQGTLTPFVPAMARLAHNLQWAEFGALTRRQSRTVLVQGIAISLLAVAAGFIARMIIAGDADLPGGLTGYDVRRITTILFLMAGMMPCIVLAVALGNAFFAYGDTRTPAKYGMVNHTAALVIKLGASYWLGLWGLAIASTLCLAALCASLELTLRRRVGALQATVGADAAASVGAVGLMGDATASES